jgi:gluconolactonase
MFPLTVLCALLGGALPAELPPDRAVRPREVILVSYTEGICFDHAGNAYISHGQVITRVEPGGAATTFARTGAPNGHKVLADGTHLVCDASRHAVLHLDARGRPLKPASTECGGVKLRAPNDLCLDPKNGGFYFTDPGGSGLKRPIGTVHYVDARGKTHLVARGLAFPNGIVLRPDGKALLVAESQRNRVLAYPVLGPGKVGKMRVLANLPKKEKKKGQIDDQPDGMCLDEAGNLYVAHYGMGQVQVVSPEGKVVRRYKGGTLTTSNVAFGGKDRDILYITGALGPEQGSRGALFTLRLKGVKGLKILPDRAPGRPAGR